jgi:hypothetical protein
MKKKENYLDKIPEINNIKWNTLDDGIIELVIENTGFYNSIAQKLFKKPRFSLIKLDKYGSFIWQQIDGKKDLFEIGKCLAGRYSDAENQLYQRLSKFFAIMEQHKYIRFINN